MKWFRFFGKKGQEQHAASEPTLRSIEDQERKHAALIELSRKLALGQEHVTQQVAEAISDEQSYVKNWFDRLDERGINGPIPDLPWIALVDALQAECLAGEIDWKQDCVTTVDVIDKLLERKRLLPEARRNIAQEAGESLHTHAFLIKMHKLLLAHSISLACMDINSDSYVLITVPADEISGLRELAAQAGYRLDDRFE